jgi:hypothetical protein
MKVILDRCTEHWVRYDLNALYMLYLLRGAPKRCIVPAVVELLRDHS